MKEQNLWQFALEKRKLGIPVGILVVMESLGSSPGRQGFKMAITASELAGSVGGGIMEHKLVEVVRDMLQNGKNDIWIKKQIHSKESPVNQSGMICSGEQTLAFFPLEALALKDHLDIVQSLSAGMVRYLEFSPNGIFVHLYFERQIGFFYQDEQDWSLFELIGIKPKIHIIGGGHVGLAFSKVMKMLSFSVHVYDNRPELNTLIYNDFTDEKTIVEYDKIDEFIPEGDNEWVAIMTFGYRTDGVVIRKLMGRNFAYLGLLGSKAKISRMWDELRDEGFPENDLNRVYSPIGLSIKSQTPEEIAISIAAQIIQVKNKEK